MAVGGASHTLRYADPGRFRSEPGSDTDAIAEVRPAGTLFRSDRHRAAGTDLRRAGCAWSRQCVLPAVFRPSFAVRQWPPGACFNHQWRPCDLQVAAPCTYQTGRRGCLSKAFLISFLRPAWLLPAWRSAGAAVWRLLRAGNSEGSACGNVVDAPVARHCCRSTKVSSARVTGAARTGLVADGTRTGRADLAASAPTVVRGAPVP